MDLCQGNQKIKKHILIYILNSKGGFQNEK